MTHLLPAILCNLALAGIVRGTAGDSGRPVILRNGEIEAVLTPILDGVRAGSLKQLTDLATGIDIAAGLQFGGIQCGPYIPLDGSFIQVSDSEVVFSSPGMIDYATMNELPVASTIDYELSGRGLEIAFTISAAGTAELLYPLEADFSAESFEQASFSNQSGVDRTVDLDGSHGLLRITGDQIVRLLREDGLLQAIFVFPNPARAVVCLSDDAEPGDAYLTLRFFDTEPPRETAAGPVLHSTLPAGYTETVNLRISFSPNFMPSYLSAHPGFLERSAAWMFDDIPFRHPPDTTLWSFSETSSGGEFVSAELISLLEAHTGMKMNWVVLPDAILAPNCDSMWAEPGMEGSWSHWHCTWRIATEATPGYLQWLVDIDQGVYPWADRVTLGSHGYHHTPSPDSAWDPFHEFITYQPAEHLERFRMIREDFEAIGLDTSRHRAVRFPGHRTSLSGLQAIIAYGYSFYCNGVRWYESMGGEPFYDLYMSHYQTPEGGIWGTNTVWWGDCSMMYPYAYLSTVMQRGKFALLGAHPINMLDGGNPAAYARIDSVCSSLENDYEHFGWLLPEEYGFFLSETAGLTFRRMQGLGNPLQIDFTGSTSRSQTMVTELLPLISVDDVLLDGDPTAWEMHGTRLFTSVDGLGPGLHHVMVFLDEPPVEPDPPPDVPPALFLASPFSGRTSMRAEGLPPSAGVRLTVFDLAGRVQLRDSLLSTAQGTIDGTVDLSRCPNGLFLFVIDGHGIPPIRACAISLPSD